jgi:MFS family permease
VAATRLVRPDDAPVRRLLPTVPDLIMLLSTMASQAIAPFVPLYAQTLGLEAGTIGLLVGAGGATALAASLLAGALLGRVGPRRLILIGSAATAAGLAAVGTWPSVAVLVVVLPLASAMQAIMAISSQTLVFLRTTPERADQRAGMHTFYASLGLTLGPLAGSAAVRTAGTLDVVFLVGAAIIGAALAVALAASAPGVVETSRPQPYLTDVLALSPAARLAVVAVLIAEFTYVGWATFYPLALRAVGRSPEAIGLVFSVQGVVISLVRPGLAALVARLSRSGALGVSFLVNAAGLLAATVPQSSGLMLACAALTGLGIGLAFPITMVMVSEGATGNRVGRLLSARFVTMMLGGVLGPSVTGLAAGWSVVGALGGVAGVAAATGLVVLSAHRRQAFLDTRKSPMLR